MQNLVIGSRLLIEMFSYQLLLQGRQGRLQPLLFSPHRVDDPRGCVHASDRLLSVHPQCPVHHLALFVPQQMQLLQAGQSRLQPLPDPAAVHSGCGGAHHPRTGALPAQHGDGSALVLLDEQSVSVSPSRCCLCRCLVF